MKSLCFFFFSSVKELEKFLSAEFLENASLTDDAKADIIIAGKVIVIKMIDFLRSQSTYVSLFNYLYKSLSAYFQVCT